jgi:hypothetical protein
MKTRSLFFSLALVLTYSVTTSAQEYTFKVLVNKGKNEIKVGGNWQPVKVGASLNSRDELKVSENAYVGLVHATGKPLEVKDAGSYTIANLAAKIGNGTSVLNKYTDFILSSNTRNKNSMTATGAVHRGTNGIKLFLPPSESAYMYGDSVTIHWSDNIRGPYVVTISTLFEDELFRKETIENSVSVNFADRAFGKETEFQIVVTSPGQNKTSEKYTVRKLAASEKNNLKNSFTELKAELTPTTGFNKYLEAGFFEQQKLLIDAATAFQKAVALQPALKEGYDDFLLRNGLKEAEEKK